MIFYQIPPKSKKWNLYITKPALQNLCSELKTQSWVNTILFPWSSYPKISKTVCGYFWMQIVHLKNLISKLILGLDWTIWKFNFFLKKRVCAAVTHSLQPEQAKALSFHNRVFFLLRGKS